jgi:hypothetical protein
VWFLIGVDWHLVAFLSHTGQFFPSLARIIGFFRNTQMRSVRWYFGRTLVSIVVILVLWSWFGQGQDPGGDGRNRRFLDIIYLGTKWTASTSKGNWAPS